MDQPLSPVGLTPIPSGGIILIWRRGSKSNRTGFSGVPRKKFTKWQLLMTAAPRSAWKRNRCGSGKGLPAHH